MRKFRKGPFPTQKTEANEPGVVPIASRNAQTKLESGVANVPATTVGSIHPVTPSYLSKASAQREEIRKKFQGIDGFGPLICRDVINKDSKALWMYIKTLSTQYTSIPLEVAKWLTKVSEAEMTDLSLIENLVIICSMFQNSLLTERRNPSFPLELLSQSSDKDQYLAKFM